MAEDFGMSTLSKVLLGAIIGVCAGWAFLALITEIAVRIAGVAK